MGSELKLAYIDYTRNGERMVDSLVERGITVVCAGNLDEFQEDSDLNDFKMLLFHPGSSQQYQLPRLVRDFSGVAIFGVTSPSSVGEYNNLQGLDFDIYTYEHVSEIEKLVREKCLVTE